MSKNHHKCIFTGTVSCDFMFSALSSGLVGLSLTYAMGMTGLFQWGVRQSAESENQMTSVERIMEYAALTSGECHTRLLCYGI